MSPIAHEKLLWEDPIVFPQLCNTYTNSPTKQKNIKDTTKGKLATTAGIGRGPSYPGSRDPPPADTNKQMHTTTKKKTKIGRGTFFVFCWCADCQGERVKPLRRHTPPWTPRPLFSTINKHVTGMQGPVHSVWSRGLASLIKYVDDGEDMRPHARCKGADPPTTPRMIYKANKTRPKHYRGIPRKQPWKRSIQCGNGLR